MAGITAVHYSLRKIDSSTGEISGLINIAHLVHGPTVNAHANVKSGTVSDRAVNLQGALRRRLGTIAEDQCHSITCG